MDSIIRFAIGELIAIAKDAKGRGKWRKALLKVFREIAAGFRDDAEFQDVMKSEVVQ